MLICVCVFTDVEILEKLVKIQQDIMTLRNVMMLYTVVRMAEG